ncbi:lipopolysaccharide biosynthesis protein [Bacteroides sp. D2]|uniref:lipopolysaccharide biosynthesis protein n=1 Tax=Bacteroides sp. D2 TaxID=556259 RepID=UPI0018DEDA73|nr:lipopolysaccharide biosynthesis protein [Bacteroides sp. D2]UWN98891.1 lipopolysaccharide biosynthesis protein [Bacteroides sp. D2]
MFIGLFSVRIVLNALGEEDYGIYNVIGGVVTMLAFLNNSLSSATQRFLSFELGKGNKKELHSIFSNSMTLYIGICVILLVLAEILGLWFVNNKLVIPNERIVAANWIYQFSIISFLCTILSSPFNAVIIAREKMGVYAYVSIAESLLKLALIYSILVLGGDKLIIYGFFMMLVSVLVFVFYMFYCLMKFEETKYRYVFDKNKIREIGSFAGWGIWGALSNIFKGQGINILLNIFFGPMVNASRGIAYQVEGAVNTLVQNFYTAMRPQLIKSYAANETEEMFKLLNISTRLGYYMMFLVSLIFLYKTPLIFSIWLEKIPQYSITFTRLALISQLFIVLANPLMTAIHATGKVAKYQFLSGCIFMLVLPFSYFILKWDYNSFWPFIVLIVSSLLYWILTIERCYKLINLSLRNYFVMVFRLFLVSLILLLGAQLLYRWGTDGWLDFIVLCFYTLVVGIMAILFIDCSKSERIMIKELILSKFHK